MEGRRPPVDKAADFANYFCTYAFLYHQKDMLSDVVRMEAYHGAVFKNKHHFQDKVVLDVGTGSGILAIWAAQAGARAVYAVEATDMAKHAETLVQANGVQGVVKVIQGSVEDVVLPEKVDVIISEWMGYFLVRESMLDSVILARDRWLKPGGVMYPSHARMWLAPVRSGLADSKRIEYEHAMTDWEDFVASTNDRFGVDMAALTPQYDREQKKYFLQTGNWCSLFPNQVVGQPACLLEMDLHTITVADIETLRCSFRLPALSSYMSVSGFAGWFDVTFKGREGNPAAEAVVLTTEPSVDHATHWGQQIFLVHPSVSVSAGDALTGDLSITRSKTNHRLMDLGISFQVEKADGSASTTTSSEYFIE